MELVVRLLADGAMIIIFFLAMYGFIMLVPRHRWVPVGLRVVAAGVTSYLAAKLAALLYQPETLRPFEKLGVDPGAAYLPNPGFPSDHMLFATFLTLAVWMVTRSRWLGISMSLLTLAMGLGRVLALVHTPLDIVGGAVLACAGVIWFYWPPMPKRSPKSAK